MIERLVIVIAAMLAIIFVPYWIGWLLVKPKSAEDNIFSNWLLGIIILTSLLIILMCIKEFIIPYVINGSV